MFLVGGGILVHGIPALHHGLEKLAAEQAFGAVIPHLGNLLVGVVAGTVTLGTVLLLKKMRGLVIR
jgi:predicted DNA repair protein MutK